MDISQRKKKLRGVRTFLSFLVLFFIVIFIFVINIYEQVIKNILKSLEMNKIPFILWFDQKMFLISLSKNILIII